jgi:hypothetical protein
MKVSIISSYSIICFACLVFGFQYGESLMGQEWITRLDYLIMFSFGFFCSLSLFVLLTYPMRDRNRGGF